MDSLNFDSSLWETRSGLVMDSERSLVLVNNGAMISCKNMFKANEGKSVYELHGKFEIFPIEKQLNQTKSIQIVEIDNNISIMNQESGSNACVKISIRSSNEIVNEFNPLKHSSGSINVYIYINGLVKIYKDEKIFQEGNLEPTNNFEILVTDVGETKDVVIILNSFDSAMNKYSMEVLVKSFYVKEQPFYVSFTLLGNNYAVGIDSLKVNDEISDPQNHENIENQIQI